MSLTVKTPIAENGELRLDPQTELGSLMAIGAIYHTRQRVGDGLEHDIQTDDAGLDSLTETASSAIFSLSLGVSAVGRLLV